MSAEIPWTAGPGEVLPKAPAVGLCGEVVVTVDGGYTHTSNPCNSPKYHDGPHTGDEIKPAPELAKPGAKVEVSLSLYEQAREAVVQACDQRDKALLDLQRVRGEAVYWQEQAYHWKTLAEGGC